MKLVEMNKSSYQKYNISYLFTKSMGKKYIDFFDIRGLSSQTYKKRLLVKPEIPCVFYVANCPICSTVSIERSKKYKSKKNKMVSNISNCLLL